jgi:hypothetical protein
MSRLPNPMGVDRAQLAARPKPRRGCFGCLWQTLWQGTLVLAAGASIFRAFLPDGTVYRGHDPSHPYNGEIVPVTLVNGSYSEFKAACAAVKK